MVPRQSRENGSPTERVGAAVNPLTIRQHVAESVTREMHSKDVTAYAMAARAGIPRTTLLRKLSAVAAFNVDELERIAGVLDIEAASLMPQAEQVA